VRTVYLVTYDIREPKRLHRVFTVCRKFGDHLQLSVFRCILNERDLIRFRGELLGEINEREDQVLFVDLGPEEGRGASAISAIGVAYTRPEHQAVIV